VRVVPLPGAEPCNRAWDLQPGRLEEAVRACDEALRLNPKLAVAHVSRREALRLLKRFDEALAEAEQAVALDRSFPSAFTLRGALYRLRGEHERTIADCTEALRLDPANSIAYLERGLAHKARRPLPGHRRLQRRNPSGPEVGPAAFLPGHRLLPAGLPRRRHR
jgi:tetratricopeptide (TPR) repeat protein